MIRLIDDLPDNVIGIEAIGEVRAGDYDSVIGPALDAALRIHDKLRLIYVLGDEFDGDSDGGIWKDATVGLARLSQWERPQPKITHGYMARYAKQVSSASQGAVVR